MGSLAGWTGRVPSDSPSESVKSWVETTMMSEGWVD